MQAQKSLLFQCVTMYSKDMETRLKDILSWIAWPVLFISCCVATCFGLQNGYPVLTFNLTYLCLAVSLLLLERYIPHEKQWLQYDGQLWIDIAHTLLSKGTVQLMVVFSAAIGIAVLITPVSQEAAFGLWPRHWPMWGQVILGLVVAEFALYWAHRLGHEWYPLWRFHAIHHSVTRLWVVNTGRFHFVDSMVSVGTGMILLGVMGAPLEVLFWMSAITAYIGILTHCNVDMRFGPISYVFNTPELHRWHHSKVLREGNMNYGENIMLWDHVFGSFYNAKDYRPPVDIGIKDQLPRAFMHQLLWSFKHDEESKRLFREGTEAFRRQKAVDRQKAA